MSAQKGNLFLIEVQTAVGPPAVYSGLTSARSTDWNINNAQVDVTTITSAGWKTLLAGAGIQDMTISVSGVWEDSAQEKILATAALANTLMTLKFTNGNADAFTGSFAVTSYKRAATYNGEETYTASFTSSGAVVYTAGT
jgi:TP901-1 family phage major tail protein